MRRLPSRDRLNRRCKPRGRWPCRGRARRARPARSSRVRPTGSAADAAGLKSRVAKPIPAIRRRQPFASSPGLTGSDRKKEAEQRRPWSKRGRRSPAANVRTRGLGVTAARRLGNGRGKPLKSLKMDAGKWRRLALARSQFGTRSDGGLAVAKMRYYGANATSRRLVASPIPKGIGE